MAQKLSKSEAYGQAYTQYINSHLRFNMEQYKAYIANHSQFVFGGVDNNTLSSIAFGDLAKLLRGTPENVDVLSKDVQEMLDSFSGDLNDLSDQTFYNSIQNKNTPPLEQLNAVVTKMGHMVDQLQLIVNTLNQMGRSNEYLASYTETLKNRINQIKQQTDQIVATGEVGPRSGKLIRWAPFYFEKGSAELKFADSSTTGKSGRYITNLRNMVSKLTPWLRQEVGLAAEPIFANVIGGLMPKMARDKIYDGVSAQGFLDKTLRGAHSAEIEGYVDSMSGVPKYQKDIRVGGSTGVVDWFYKANNINMVVKVSQKQVKLNTDSIGNQTGNIKGMNVSVRRMIAASSDNQYLTYGLLRALNGADSYGTTKGQFKDLKSAWLREYAFESIFGSEKDTVTDLLINGVFYSGGAVARHLFSNLENASFSKYLQGTLYGNYKAQFDPKNLDSSINSESARAYQSWVTPSAIRAILTGLFKIEWYFDKRKFA